MQIRKRNHIETPANDDEEDEEQELDSQEGGNKKFDLVLVSLG